MSVSQRIISLYVVRVLYVIRPLLTPFSRPCLFGYLTDLEFNTNIDSNPSEGTIARFSFYIGSSARVHGTLLGFVLSVNNKLDHLRAELITLDLASQLRLIHNLI